MVRNIRGARDVELNTRTLAVRRLHSSFWPFALPVLGRLGGSDEGERKGAQKGHQSSIPPSSGRGAADIV